MRAPAKVNLALAVLGRRPDGYHELRSVVGRLALADDLSIAVAGGAAGGRDSLRRRPEDASPAADDLVLRAAATLRAWADRPLRPLGFTLRKRIPVAAGLGGGSSDAAAALRLAAAAWGMAIDEPRLARLGAALGSDVPFFLADCALALVEGRGDRVRCLGGRGAAAGAPARSPGLLLACSPGKSSTAAVFAGLAAARAVPDAPGAASPITDRLVARLEGGDPHRALLGLAPELRDANDLWPAAARLMPHLPRLRGALERALGLPVLLSGAGPTLFVLYPSPTAAEEARRVLRGRVAEGTVGALPHGPVRLIATSLEHAIAPGRTA